MVNPVLPQLLQELRLHPEGVSEYYLMQQMERQGVFDDMEAEGALALYRKHFIIMNALYDLQNVLWDEEGRVLSISPMQVALHEPGTDWEQYKPNPDLSSYYLDWHNFETTTAEDVATLMHSVSGSRH